MHMRLVHLAYLTETGHVEPRCGAWGSMDSDWTDVADGVTCVGCGAPIPRSSTAVPGRARATGVLGAARKLAVLLVGGTVLAFGLALVVLPGPAFLVIPAGLAILATEFLWARRLLRYAKERVVRLIGARRVRVAPGS